MPALTAYRLGLLFRSARWLPPFLLWAAIVAIGSTPGQPFAEVIAYNCMALVPASAWTARVVLLAEPDASRAVLVAARGPVRVHLASIAAAALVGTGLAVLGIGAAGATVGFADPALATAAGWGTMLAAGLAAGVACVLVGVAIGAACTTPLERRPGIAIPATGILAVAALVAAGSPAQAAVTGVADAPGPEANAALLAALASAVLVASVAAAGTAWWSRARS
ncbi:hypothetical protein [Nocardiopsis trehalosi]|jgi:hypothetical protein|uniref:hypothetical protein n=1 Tax=Nocardiopsis trehalosi TaxID=109329 RepID=UPI0008329B3A|nr:hypothetical protein [Nocardiopsis trehalosi]